MHYIKYPIESQYPAGILINHLLYMVFNAPYLNISVHVCSSCPFPCQPAHSQKAKNLPMGQASGFLRLQVRFFS
jgi:hypothetical protein